MSDGRFVVLGLARARSSWFRDVGRWAMAAAIPVEFVRCVSAEEVRARLDGGRAFSALIVDAAVHGVDRDLLDTVTRTGTAVFVVDDGRAARDWMALGATAVLPENVGRDELMEELERHGHPLERTDSLPPSITGAGDTGVADWSGRLVAVTGGSGAGSSTVAMALAQGLGDDPRYGELTLLADLSLHADLAMFHDARDIVPGLQEVVDAHRGGSPSLGQLRSLVFDVPDRRYHLLLGLRRHRDWTTLRTRTVGATIESLLRAYRAVVVDIDADVEGEAETGSLDVEERNVLARTTLQRADLVVTVGTPTVKGLHDLLRVVDDIVRFGVDPAAVLPVLNRSTRPGRARAEVTRALGELLAPISTGLPAPIHLPERRRLDDAIRDGVRLPSPFATTMASAVSAVLDRLDRPTPVAAVEPVPIVPGSLGHYADLHEHRAELDDLSDGAA